MSSDLQHTIKTHARRLYFISAAFRVALAMVLTALIILLFG